MSFEELCQRYGRRDNANLFRDILTRHSSVADLNREEFLEKCRQVWPDLEIKWRYWICATLLDGDDETVKRNLEEFHQMGFIDQIILIPAIQVRKETILVYVLDQGYNINNLLSDPLYRDMFEEIVTLPDSTLDLIDSYYPLDYERYHSEFSKVFQRILKYRNMDGSIHPSSIRNVEKFRRRSPYLSF